MDLANPFVPGAFRFTPEQGLVWVEGVPQARQARPDDRQGAVTATFARRDSTGGNGPVVVPPPTVQWDGTSWLALVRTGDPPARDLSPDEGDDH
jgi:hypothetical protein